MSWLFFLGSGGGGAGGGDGKSGLLVETFAEGGGGGGGGTRVSSIVEIIFGGGVFGPALKFLDSIYDEAKKWAQPISILQVKLHGSALGNEAGLYGAAYLALKG